MRGCVRECACVRERARACVRQPVMHARARAHEATPSSARVCLLVRELVVTRVMARDQRTHRTLAQRTCVERDGACTRAGVHMVGSHPSRFDEFRRAVGLARSSADEIPMELALGAARRHNGRLRGRRERVSKRLNGER
eukprot:6206644-Pleurochrysis_carterae.AAC.1